MKFNKKVKVLLFVVCIFVMEDISVGNLIRIRLRLYWL